MSFENATRSVYASYFTESEEMILICIISVTLCLSLYGNIGMLIVLYGNDKMWNSTNMLIGNLAFSGVLVSVFCMPFSLISLLYSRWPFDEGPVCRFNAFVTSTLLLATILTHTMLSVDKFFGVVKPFSRAMTAKRTWKVIFLVWFLAVIMSVGPLVHFGSYRYNQTTLICGVGFPKNKKDSLYLFLLASIGFAIPNLIMGYVYLKIFRAARQHRKRLQTNSLTSHVVLNLQRRLILTTFFSLLCFVLCWAPFCALVVIATVVDSVEKIPRGLGVSAYCCGYLYNALNPLIICTMSKRFGEGLINLTCSIATIAPLMKDKCSTLCCNSTKKFDYSKGNEHSPSLPTPTMIYLNWKSDVRESGTEVESVSTQTPQDTRLSSESHTSDGEQPELTPTLNHLEWSAF